ncbi:2-amino-4-hydroxy-6-hydroxymethyldihydropteridine diphosphokinase [Streptococcus saliviloxodontae]|uniref:2-amino-4-hydroxy-6-hydroxymethyldihydropteridine diphosphokinase n=1 Tax=Streptococcus saliviloxodontae TaxID=1349416 RepID=A0ABS2PLL6_9STRE|nr:2-amino-4-hydroxy-6-hydroxymethyldihydropteridine diphosphokinase [Streptococcus saliviloxodontae]MBM7636319.1 2-amino-4-hydroxy-6-hydroxymethyldihydropteridine diphosphokinase [Streptococcus saliviloxodontae]
MSSVFLSLGSNMGDRKWYLQTAIELLDQLPQTRLVEVSSLYQTAAWGKTDQDDFLNMACQLETRLDKFDLLHHCQRIEKELDRVRHEHWGPRTVDIDILLYDDEISQQDELQLPHPFMTERAFVLVPLLEIVPTLKSPVSQVEYATHLAQLDSSDVVKVES